VKETKGSMYSYKLKLNQSLLQLKRFKDVIERIKEENQNKVIESVKSHFAKIDKIVRNAEKLANQKFEVQRKKQEKRVKEMFEGLKDIENILCLNKNKIHDYLHSKEDDMVLELDTIEAIVNNQIDIIPKIAIPDFKLRFATDNTDLVKIDQFLNTMHQYSFVTNDNDEVSKLLNDSFLIKNFWI
jgi:hypothetical protein